MTTSPRIAAVLVGDIHRDSPARAKYSLFFNALAQHFPLVDVFDATLSGLDRWLNTAREWHPNDQTRRERAYKNAFAFRAHSRRVAHRLQFLQGKIDKVLQIGLMFDATARSALPTLIYADTTARLATPLGEDGQALLPAAQQTAWFDLEKQALARAAHIAASSAFVRDSLLKDYAVPPAKVTVVGSGVNYEPLPSISATRALGAPPTALFIGKEFVRKGGLFLLEAFDRVRAQLPNALLLLITNGPLPADAPLTGVEVIAPTWNRDTIASYYRRADIFVLPNRQGIWSDVVLEAMAFGLPCVGVTGQGMEEMIEHDQTGLLVSPEVASYAEAMVSLLQQRYLCRQMGATGRKRVDRDFTWARVVERLNPHVAL